MERIADKYAIDNAMWADLASSSHRITVLAHGCFDILHLGHIRHLKEAKSFGDYLVVSVTADKWVNKGIGRPHFTAEQRAEALRALDCVDEVYINDDEGCWDLIRKIKPAFYVKGCLLYTSPSPRDGATSRMPSSA